MKPMNKKCEQFTDSVIRRMTRIAIANNAINLAQGFPDFDPPKALTDRLIEVAVSGPHQYPITMGAPNFRRAVAAIRPDELRVITVEDEPFARTLAVSAEKLEEVRMSLLEARDSGAVC